ncbi:aminopeptidase [Vallitalea guaymasensis]|uniref:aminopeptidase n=1 Tax=Vallitalea guaymasensis TaxID=1185412 RepID=UPI00272C50BF|nr:aminopeptidase [Vallitalea guaymasensis]
MDSRIVKLAKILVNYSCKVKEGDKVLIQHVGDSTLPLTRQLIKEIYAVGGIPFEKHIDESVQRELLLNCTKEQIDLMAEADLTIMREMDCYIGVRASNNVNELSDVPSDKRGLYEMYHFTPVHRDVRVPDTRWVVMRYPNNSMAQLANTSLEDFEDFYFNVCTLDYGKMSKAMDNLVDLMNKTDKVRIVGEGTDISFSIKGLPAIKCDGGCNIPDGEVYSAPVKDSVNGVISYNTPAVYRGFTYENIVFEFENGKIIKATANDTEKINAVLNTDEGARYIGEFAIGVNPYILNPLKDTLFDEKIMGSIHFTPGNSYDDCDNENHSAIHWDLVYIQTPDFGGGEIYFDDVLIRKDGMFVVPELECLNPENLK